MTAKDTRDMRPQVAWCWASGLIEVGDKPPANNADGSGCIVFATGPRADLMAQLSAVARHGYGASAGQLIVPGVPEADSPTEAVDALTAWVNKCALRKSQSVFSNKLAKDFS